jgi:Ca2+-binding RTX toxin-like protein
VSANLELGTVANDGYGFADTVPQTGGLSTIEVLIGSAFDDVLVGDIGPNEIHGLAGDDFLDGRAGFDFLDGGAHVVGDECVNGEALFDCEL